MRVLLRILFALMLLAGVLLGIVMPRAAERMAGYEIGRWQVYNSSTGEFRPVDVMLAASDAPVFIAVNLRTEGPLRAGEAGVLSLKAARGGEVALNEVLHFGHPGTRESPQVRELTYTEEPGPLDSTEGSYTFTVGPGDAMPPGIVSVELVLNAGAYDLDPRAEPAGYTMMVLGVVGFGLTMRRRARPKATPPAPRWGRGDEPPRGP